MSLFKRKRIPNYAEYLTDLFQSVSFGSEYSDTDQLRDFRQVFMETEQGKRVFYTIMAYAGLYSPDLAPIDPNELQRVEGRRELARHIMALTFKEALPPMEIIQDED